MTIKRISFNNNIMWILIVLFLAIITGNAIADTKWIYFIAILIPFLLYLCIEKPFVFPLGLYVFSLPFDSILSVVGSAQGATLTKFLGVLSIMVLVLKGIFENKLKKPDAASIWWMLFIIYACLSVCWAIRPEVVLSRMQTVCGLFLLYLIIASYQIQKAEFDTLKYCIIAGGVLAAMIAIYSYKSGLFSEENTQRASLFISDRTTNPNYVAFTMLIPTAVCLQMVLDQNSKMMKGLFCIFFGMLVFGIVVTGSRGGLLGAGIIVIIYIISIKQRIGYGTILIIIGIIMMQFIPDFVVGRWGQSVEGGGAGRLDIWYVGYKALGKYWLIGAGLSNFPNAYTEFSQYASDYTGYGSDPHNVYLGVFVEFGILGISLMIIGIIKHYRLIKSSFTQYNSNQIMLKAALCGILVSCFFGEYIWFKPFWLIFMMIMMHGNISKDKSKEQHSCNQRDEVSSEQLTIDKLNINKND